MNLTTPNLFPFAPYPVDVSGLPYPMMAPSNQLPILPPMAAFNYGYGMKFGMPLLPGYPVLYQRFPQQHAPTMT